MATFKYAVRDKAGKVVKGKLDGESKDAVQSQAAPRWATSSWSSNSRAASPRSSAIKFGTGVKPKDITIFARQFATMINAGLSLTKCLSILSASRPRARACARSSPRSARTSRPVSRSPTRWRSTPRSSRRSSSTWFAPVRRAVCSTRSCNRVADHFEREQALKAQDQVGDDVPDRDGRARPHRPRPR